MVLFIVIKEKGAVILSLNIYLILLFWKSFDSENDKNLENIKLKELISNLESTIRRYNINYYFYLIVLNLLMNRMSETQRKKATKLRIWNWKIPIQNFSKI